MRVTNNGGMRRKLGGKNSRLTRRNAALRTPSVGLFTEKNAWRYGAQHRREEKINFPNLRRLLY